MGIDWEYEIGGNSLAAYGTALLGALIAAMGFMVAQKIVSWRLRRWSDRDDNLPLYLVWHGLEATRAGFILGGALAIAAHRLELPAALVPWLRTLFVGFLILQVLAWGNRILTAWRDRYEQESAAELGARYTTVRMFIFFSRLVFCTVCAVLFVDNLPGVEITALVASLGIGGIAVALALQNILSDIFASLTITLDKPFVIGDFIIVDNHLGVVEKIGLKTTRIRSLSGEQLIFANADLLKSRVRNFKRMDERRVAYNISVTYDTDLEQLRKIPPKVKSIIEELEHTRFDRAHFKQHADFALVFEIVYYVIGPDYNRYMDIQQAINLATHEFFEAEGIEWAFPTQTLYLRQDDGSLEKALVAAGGEKADDAEASGEASGAA